MAKYLYKNKWVSLKETSRGFVYGERKNVNSTATLLFRLKNGRYEFLLRYQPLPELKISRYRGLKWTTLYPCCVTGSLEENETPQQNCIKEVWEETNYIIHKNDIKSQTIAVASTQMNEAVYTFLVDISKAKFDRKKTGDGSIFESVSKNYWVSHEKMLSILQSDKEIYLSSLASAYLLFEKSILKPNV